MMRIGYAKLGRSMPLDPANWGVVGGDDEPPLMLKTLAERRPQDEFIIVGRNSGEEPTSVGLPANVTNPWTELREPVTRDTKAKSAAEIVAALDHHTIDLFRGLDALIVWTGQHGTSNTPIPKVGSGWEDVTSPQEAFLRYASYIVRGINAFRAEDPLQREEIWLCPDPRNYVKARDLKWPIRHPVLGQFDFERWEKHERYGDTRTPEECGFENVKREGSHLWKAKQRYMYSRLEICGILPEHVPSDYVENWSEREHFGLFINEARAYVKHNRLDALRDWVLPIEPHFIHGKWSDKSLAKIDRKIEPAPAEVYYDKLRSVKCTFTTPSSGSGWATTKPWQAFGTGTVCFFHPEYDTQGHIIPTMEQVKKGEVESETLRNLATWLRPATPDDLATRVRQLEHDEGTWRWLVQQQRRLYDWACSDPWITHLIDYRLETT